MWRIYDLTTTLTATASTYATLLAALQALTAANASVTTTGNVVSTSANGRSVTFSDGDTGSAPSDYAKCASDLRDLYVDSKADLISAAVAASPTDLQIFTEMMDRLRPVKSLAPSNFSALRCA